MEQLSEVNVDGVEPMTSVTPMEMRKRADAVTDGNKADAIVAILTPLVKAILAE